MSRLTSSTPTTHLATDSLGISGLMFMVIAVTAPLTAVASNLTLGVAFGGGTGTVGVMVVATIVLAVFTVGCVAVSREVVNSAAYYGSTATASAAGPAPPRR
ncbi:hypothetical protein ACFYO2_40375 [Streptomyces sp. NPDC006602]|uniref:hypothetical protein n=1 Tax=Streptomyces sp. NPDC006602 TaxID=3364751 RepID=UPI00369DF88D